MNCYIGNLSIDQFTQKAAVHNWFNIVIHVCWQVLADIYSVSQKFF